MIAIGPAHDADFSAVAALLEANHLPTAGLRDSLPHGVVARDGARIVGYAALEVYPGGVLLRSVAVDERIRGRGVGQQLTEGALALAVRNGAKAAFLLTTTAENFFPRFGFGRITRDEVPVDVRQSIEFTSACPASAIVMRLDFGLR
jgi:amino-acid N-acetyltransferase